METGLTIIERSRRDELLARIKQLLKSFIDVGESLLEFRTKRLYRDQYATFDEFCESECGIKRSYAHQVIASYQAVLAVRMSAIADILPQTETHARELTRLEDSTQQVVAWEKVVERVDGDPKKVTAKLVREEVNKLLPAKEDDTFTPLEEAEVIRKFLLGRFHKWPAFYRPTFGAFVGNIVTGLAQQLTDTEGDDGGD